eukprot:scaffold34921_cov236-Isochrysis_galbana.AAC.9
MRDGMSKAPYALGRGHSVACRDGEGLTVCNRLAEAELPSTWVEMVMLASDAAPVTGVCKANREVCVRVSCMRRLV